MEGILAAGGRNKKVAVTTTSRAREIKGQMDSATNNKPDNLDFISRPLWVKPRLNVFLRAQLGLVRLAEDLGVRQAIKRIVEAKVCSEGPVHHSIGREL